jgi:hypothetical protein
LASFQTSCSLLRAVLISDSFKRRPLTVNYLRPHNISSGNNFLQTKKNPAQVPGFQCPL